MSTPSNTTDNQSMVSELSRLLKLRFEDKTQERDFFQRFIVDYRHFHQVALIQAATLYYIFFLWDKIIDASHYEVTQFIRGAIFAPYALLLVAFLHFDKKAKYHEAMMTSVSLLANCLLTVIYCILDRGMEYGAVGLVLVTLFVFTLIQTRIAYFVIYGVVTLIAFNVGQWWIGLEAGKAAINNLSLGTAVFLGLYSAFHREREARRRFVLEIELINAKRKVEDLLYSMLPNDIVRRIELGEKIIADSYGEVSIVFADLVGFTQLARKLAPNHLVEMLNQLFSEFDSLAREYKIEKIKTIGDAYMAISGVGKDGEGQAARAADFALAIRDAVGRVSKTNDLNLQVRIGLHIGPVVAGVIGNTRPAYDCWGDAVNVASRLESSAIAGSIHISEQAYWRLHSEFEMAQSQEMEIKGLGNTTTHTLLGRRST